MAAFVYASDNALAERFTAMTGVTVTVRVLRNSNSRRVSFSDRAGECTVAAALARIERALERADAAKYLAA